MAGRETDVLRGTLDLLILRTIKSQPLHGWAISQRIQEMSSDALRIGQGSLYPALQRLEQQGWIDSETQKTDQGRNTKFYFLTTSGKRALASETAEWRRYVRIVDLILDTP
jgi:transcriptional regulator